LSTHKIVLFRLRDKLIL